MYIFLNQLFIEVYLIYNVVLISALQQSDSVIHIFLIFFSIMVNHRILNIVLCEGMYIVFKNIMLLDDDTYEDKYLTISVITLDGDTYLD